ncbi:hypothetical protein BC941DRAFT_108264 [Chlamydoabsidia padenii]|nr:hypothetical protein BC941DRAFT_108264 [Chlamydoabsidia padenii]
MGRRRRRQRQQQTNEEGSPTALETILQNALSNLLASGLNDDTANDRSRINNNDNNNNNDGPVYFYRGVVDGNVQLDPIRPPSQTRSSSLGATSRVYFQMGDGGNDDDDDDDVDEWVDEETNGQRGRNNRVNNLQGLLRAIAALAGDSMDLDIVGNPDDYVFSQTALDNIVTQLMEQTGGRTAPPPAPDDVIAALPKRPISEKEFRDQIDCSVCKDDFIVDEMVIELPCMHLFHGDCIDPWLKVNGTCPV